MIEKFITTPIQFMYKKPSEIDLNWLLSHNQPTQLIEDNRISLAHSYVQLGLKGAEKKVFARKSIVLNLKKMLSFLPNEYSICVFDVFRKKETQLDLFQYTYNEQKKNTLN
jgi:hypothetical protein